LRVMVVAFLAGTAAGFVLGGSGLASNIALLTLLGGLIGIGSRRRWGQLRTMGTALLVVWPPVAGGTVALLAVFAGLRRLSFDQARNSWGGTARVLRNFSLGPVADAGTTTLSWVLRHWYLVVPAVELLGLAVLARVAHGLSVRVLPRIGPPRARVPLGDGQGPTWNGRAAAPGPVPLRLEGVSFAYPGATAPTLHDVSLEIGTGELWAVVGANGAGKSSFARVLAGATVEGTVTRAGGVGLGGVGGTAMIFQRPESQVLGVRVRDDVLWGLTREEARRVDVERLLEEFGLGGLAERETATLSGGQLQRLALAGAVARRPGLLVSDESTAMVDAAGRRRLMEQLRTLVTSRGTTVVHVTHRRAEIQPGDRLLQVAGGVVTPVASVVAAKPPVIPPPVRPPGGVVLDLRDVGFVYSARSPWEHRALDGVTTSVRAGETVLVVGSNGSGKSTLAWILAGLLPPTEGRADLDHVPVADQVGHVALGFQHARLQLLRPRVRDELSIAVDDDISIARALSRVGLDPLLAARPIDSLSGGQQRRVLLARLLASGPRVLVLDEPFAGLDDDARTTLSSVLAGLRATREVAIVVVSHDLDDVAPFADRLLGLHAGRLVIDAGVDALDEAAALIKQDGRS
ncbi:MAG: ATP-binding cassette domain-containing protein, partial [Actinobacteria bacterium]|nr:ATP-binding cassette domain-containing protein [Actinomycetota bacterium]